MTDVELPKGGEWAAGSLLDPANVGRYVWCSWNGNKANLIQISYVGRSVVRVANSSDNYRVDPARVGLGMNRGKWSSSVETNELRNARVEEARLRHRASKIDWRSLPIETVKAVLDLVEPSGE